jgi:hypothetical protein
MVNYIPDISGQTINDTEYQDILEDLNNAAERSSKILQDMKKMNELSNKSLTEALTDILKFRKEINQRLLTPDLLIITDHHNKAIKIVDITSKSVQARHNFDSEPWDVTSVSQNEVAVTLPRHQTIQFFSVSRNNLKQKHTLKVDGKCYGISCHKDKIVVLYKHPVKVQILHINGTVLQTIQDENIFKEPRCIRTSDNYIFVSDYILQKVIKLNWQLEVTCKYHCLTTPHGLTMSDVGTVFVCYWSDHTITEISEDCSEEQIVVKDIRYPQAVYWSAETCTLFTSSLSFPESDYIKLFKLSK